MQIQGRVAVIDIGSNTIKLLVAERKGDDQVEPVYRNTLETRIGTGIGADRPMLTADAIVRASDAVAALVEEAGPFQPAMIRIVATSAVRDAENRQDFIEAVRAKTGLTLEVLSGRQEAELIGAAIQLDPQITAPDFYVFDLGGGSLECLRFSNRQLDCVVSVPLGCVRLTEQLIAEPNQIFSQCDQNAIEAEVEETLKASGFEFSLPPAALAIGTGGTLTTALNIAAAQQKRELHEMPQYLSLADLEALLALVGGLALPERLNTPRLSAGRADVFPTALATFIKLGKLCRQKGLHHSYLNLRYGLASELLSGR